MRYAFLTSLMCQRHLACLPLRWEAMSPCECWAHLRLLCTHVYSLPSKLRDSWPLKQNQVVSRSPCCDRCFAVLKKVYSRTDKCFAVLKRLYRQVRCVAQRGVKREQTDTLLISVQAEIGSCFAVLKVCTACTARWFAVPWELSSVNRYTPHPCIGVWTLLQGLS